MPSFIFLISSLCHQLIICACQDSDTLDSLHAVGEQRQDDDTPADSADLAAGQWCKLQSHWCVHACMHECENVGYSVCQGPL